ncbi:MAG: ABC transporter permease [Anaerolineae bacterium]|nr:ABC transporter permease [Anaerolineae bacterium]MEB2367111.1 ABC transporter permease [Chloroflexota bacterium]
MLKYLVRRILISAPVLLMITIIIFGLTEIAPGDVVDYFRSPDLEMTAEAEAALRTRFGLDQPAAVRYFKWLGNVARGDFGYRFTDGEPVAVVIGRRLNASLLLMGTALAIGVLVGVPLGVFIGQRQYSFWDFSLTGFSFLGISTPSFVTGIVALLVFAINLRWFPAGGMRPVDSEATLGSTIHHLLLPSIVLSLNFIATFMRYTRFSMLEVVRLDYVNTARAKGISPTAVTWRHIVPNAILPVITVIGLSVPTLVVGAVFTETIFSWPGMGSLYLDAVRGRDVPLLMGMNLVIALFVLGANILTDVAYAVVDPRIRYD